MTASPLLLRIVLIAILGGLLFRLLPIALGMPALAELFMAWVAENVPEEA